MKWACAASTTFVFSSMTFAFPPGTPVGQPFNPVSGAQHSHLYHDVYVPMNQVTAVGNLSMRMNALDVVQMKKLENGMQVPERIVSGARFVGISQDRKSIILRIPENDIGALHSSLTNGGIILTQHR